MFGTALKTGINCCCFLKKEYSNCNIEFLQNEKRDDIGVVLAKFDFFSETIQYTHNITTNKYIHNMIRMIDHRN